MPNTKSAEKALRQSKRRRTENLAKMRALKSILKDYKNLAAEKKIQEAAKELSLVYKKLDKAAKTNLIKKNTAARLKSRLTKLLSR